MIVPSDIRRSYEFDQPYVTRVEGRVRDIVLTYCEDNGYAYLGRRKSLTSLAEKLESGRFKSWDSIDDIFACCIVIPHLEKESTVIEFLDSRFRRVEMRKRGETRKSPDTFRFDSTRYIGNLKFAAGVEPHPKIANLSFEIQIRSAFEHAWSVSMHGVDYKPDEIDWKRKRLSAQIKAAVEQLDQLIVSFETAKSPIIESPWPDTEILQKISDHFHAMQSIIPTESVPDSWGRFSENLYALLRSSKSCPRDFEKRSVYVHSCLNEIETQFKLLTTFPKSVSLFQLVFGILWDKKKIKPRLQRFVPLVTAELEELYPSVLSCTDRFVFSVS